MKRGLIVYPPKNLEVNMSHSKKEERSSKQRKDSQHSHGEEKAFVKIGEEIAKITKKYDE